MGKSFLARLRILRARDIGWWLGCIGEWLAAPANPFGNSYEMRRLLKDGTYEYRPMTKEELEDHFSRNAW
jgi:hypothetical protein